MTIDQARERLRLAETDSSQPLSRQRRWQLQRFVSGKCETCGRDRGVGRENLNTCEGCGKRRYKRRLEIEQSNEFFDVLENRRDNRQVPAARA